MKIVEIEIINDWIIRVILDSLEEKYDWEFNKQYITNVALPDKFTKEKDSEHIWDGDMGWCEEQENGLLFVTYFWRAVLEKEGITFDSMVKRLSAKYPVYKGSKYL